LSPNLVDYLDAPFPFIVGVTKKLWTEICQNRWERLDEDVVVFDLVSHSVQYKTAMPSTRLPEVVTIIEQLEQKVSKLNELQKSLM
jgi:hypothetical protein